MQGDMVCGAIARGLLVDWEGKFAFGGGLGFDPEFALFSGPEGALVFEKRGKEEQIPPENL